MSSLEQRLLEKLAPPKRATAEAILARSESDTVSAKALETALALIHVRAEHATGCLLAVLARSVVFVLLKDPQDWTSALILEGESDDAYLGTFTSEDQAEIARQEYGESYQSIAIDVALLCRSLKGALGLALNPHDEVLSFQISPHIFTPFRETLEQRSQPVIGRHYSVLSGQSGYHAVRIDSITPTVIQLTWIETGWPMRPDTFPEEANSKHPSEPYEASLKAFQRWVPLSIDEPA